jgi:very-short-patch-repair endonuclease
MAAGPGAALSHSSALYHWALVEAPGREDPIHLTLSDRRHRPHPKIVYHLARALGPEDVVERNGLRLTAVPRTLLDCSTVIAPALIDQAIAIAQRRGLITREELVGVVARFRGHAGVRVLRAFLSHGHEPRFVRSEAERVCGQMITEARLPLPETNVRIEPYEVDMLWRKHRVIVEVDGHAFHSSRTAFERDREKTNWLTAQGYTVLRVTWHQLRKQQLAVAAQIASALTAAKQRMREGSGGDGDGRGSHGFESGGSLPDPNE